MFGLKIFNQTKTNHFKSDKKRKQYFAIKSYYEKKNNDTKGAQSKSSAFHIFGSKK